MTFFEKFFIKKVSFLETLNIYNSYEQNCIITLVVLIIRLFPNRL